MCMFCIFIHEYNGEVVREKEVLSEAKRAAKVRRLKAVVRSPDFVPRRNLFINPSENQFHLTTTHKKPPLHF